MLIYSLIIFVIFLFPAIFGGCLRKKKDRATEPKAVFIGLNEIANNIRSLSELLEENKIVVRKSIPSENKFYGEKNSNYESLRSNIITVLYKYISPIFHLPWILFKADQAWFIWHRSILPYNFDYILYSIARVDLVVQHCGDDVRCRHLHDALFNKYTPGITSGQHVRYRFFDMVQKYYRQSIAEFFGKTISIRNQATFQKSQLGHFFFSQKMLREKPRKPSEKTIIVHAPSDRSIKRTDIVLEAITRLKEKKYNFEFVLLEDMPNIQVIKILNETDIAVDQPGTWPARFAIEAAAASCAVVSGNHFSFIGKPSCPIIQFPGNVDDLTSSLEKLLLDKVYLSSVMEASWLFWRENYSPEVCMKNYLSVWNNTHQKFSALPDQKQLLLSATKGISERMFIRLFYFPARSDTN